MKILIIDDEKDIISFLKSALKGLGHAVDSACSGNEGSILARSNHYDLIVLDYNLPEKDGLEILKEIRREGKKVPVLALTINAELEKKRDMFKNGADDYLTKPFLLEEFIWRTEALLKRPPIIKHKKPRLGNMQLDCKRQVLVRSGRHIYLTSKEYGLLDLFFRRPNEILSRSQIMENVWENNADPFSNTIEAHIMSLRKKLNKDSEPDYIHTFAGRGYKFGLKRI